MVKKALRRSSSFSSFGLDPPVIDAVEATTPIEVSLINRAPSPFQLSTPLPKKTSPTPSHRSFRKPVPVDLVINVGERIEKKDLEGAMKKSNSSKDLTRPPKSPNRTSSAFPTSISSYFDLAGQESNSSDSEGAINFHRRPSQTPPPSADPIGYSIIPVPDLPTISNPELGLRAKRNYSTRVNRPTSLVTKEGSRSLYTSATTVLKEISPKTMDSPSPEPLPVASPSFSDANSPPIVTSPSSPTLSLKTRQPLEAFGSYEMMQGARRSSGRQSAVFNSGMYEGRALSSERSDRSDPAAAVKLARGIIRRPSVMQDVNTTLANLRDNAGADGERKFDHDWRRRFSSTSSESTVSNSSPAKIEFANSVSFAFPIRTKPSFSGEGDIGAVDLDGPFSEKSLFPEEFLPMPYSEKEKLAASSYSMNSNSIVTLPSYPSPNGTTSRSWGYRLRNFGSKLAIITALLQIVATWIYLEKRIENVTIVVVKYPHVFVAAWVFLSLEIVIAVLLGCHAMVSVFTYKAIGSAPVLRFKGDSNLSTIDVFIISSGQSDSTVFDTAIAAASLDYPTNRFRVLVVDPNGSLNLQRLIIAHSKTQNCPHLSYHRRSLHGAGDIVHSRANSINFALAESDTFKSGGGEFIIVLEGDVIVERNFIRAVLPYVLGFPRVAMVLTAQGFYNLPKRISQSIATLMDASNIDNSSGFLIRRSGLLEVGGFPQDSYLPDGLLVALFEGKGYAITALDEVLSYGTVKAYGTQIGNMMKNSLDGLRTAARLNFFLRGDKIALMPWSSRSIALAKAFRPLLAILMTILTFVYPFMFSYGGILVLTPSLTELIILLQFTGAYILISRIHEILWTWSTGKSSPRRAFQRWIFSAPYIGVAIFFLILPSWLGGYTRGDIHLGSHAMTRPRLLKRIGWLIMDPHVSVTFSFLGAILVAIYRAEKNWENGTIDLNQTLLTILLTIGWPALLLIDFIFGSIIPFSALLFPARLLSSRESLLIRDEHSQVARPKHANKTAQPLKVNRFPEFLSGLLLIGYAVGMVLVAMMTDLFA